MAFEIRLAESQPWLGIGDWFDSFIDLGHKLHRAQTDGMVIRRVLLSVPQSEMVSLALAIGFSRATYLAEKNHAVEVELDDIQVGDLIQLRSVWQQEKGNIKAPANIVGQIVAIDKPNDDGVLLTFAFNSTGLKEPRKIMRLQCPSGEKDPIRHIRLYKVPAGTPQRPGKVPREFKKEKMQNSALQSWVRKWENWEYQIFPTLAIFGSPTKLNDYGKPQFKDHELHEMLLKIDHDSFLNAARLDSLSLDTKPHFVNVIDQISNFPKKGSPAFESFSNFPFVCLDGNAALVGLSDKILLDDKCVIGLWETSKPNLQEMALETFLARATHFRAIDNFEAQIDWVAPAGIQCWGWK
jgi:hypothetical protein